MSKHSSSAVLAFDPKSRQSSRRGSSPETQRPDRWLAKAFARQRAERRQLAKALDVTPEELSEALYYNGRDVLAIEAAYRSGVAEGRQALLNALNEFHDLGYGAGLEDGRTPAAAAR